MPSSALLSPQYPLMRKTHPLGGSGAVKQRLNAEKRARLRPGERAAKAKLAAKLAEERRRKRAAAGERAEVLALIPRGPTPLEIKQAARDYDQNSLRLPLEALETRQCRWPVNDPEPKGQYLFSGREFGARLPLLQAPRSPFGDPDPAAETPQATRLTAIDCISTASRAMGMSIAQVRDYFYKDLGDLWLARLRISPRPPRTDPRPGRLAKAGATAGSIPRRG